VLRELFAEISTKAEVLVLCGDLTEARLRSGEITENAMRNGMMRCAACGRSLAEDAAWKGGGERYYCNEFCADVEAPESPSLVPTMPEVVRAHMAANSRGRV
jgi:hypothetical protein